MVYCRELRMRWCAEDLGLSLRWHKDRLVVGPRHSCSIAKLMTISLRCALPLVGLLLMLRRGQYVVFVNMLVVDTVCAGYRYCSYK